MSTMTLHLTPAPRATARPAAAPRQDTSRPAGSVRLTRRGRLVVFGSALLILLALSVFWGSGSVATRDPGTPVPTDVVVVGSGETLWSIAGDVAADSGGDVREVMFEIERLNALDSEFVFAGQLLRVPATS